MKSSEPAGTFILVPLADGTFGYGRVTHEPFMAFYDLRTEAPVSDLVSIASAPVLFTVAVNGSGRSAWKTLGVAPLEGAVASPAVFYMQGTFNLLDCRIFDTGGSSRPATPEECVGLEVASSWETRNVQNRLLDHFEGRENAEEVFGRVRLP